MIDAAGLRVVKAIADEGSFTGAANALGFTQPAISQMVRRLEQRTGTALVGDGLDHPQPCGIDHDPII